MNISTYKSIKFRSLLYDLGNGPVKLLPDARLQQHTTYNHLDKNSNGPNFEAKLTLINKQSASEASKRDVGL